MGKYYELLRKSELEKLVIKWDRLSGNIKNTKAEKTNILPDMLWVSNRGVNKTELLYYLSEYMFSESNLMSFRGRVKFVEFKLGCFSDVPDSFDELRRFYDTVHYAAGYRDSFRGIVYVDITEWADHINKQFVSFLEYLAVNTDKWFIILNVDNNIPEEKINALETAISTYLRIERQDIRNPRIDALLDYAVKELAAYDFEVNDKGRELLRESFKKLKSSKNFDGYNTIRNFCADIIYDALSKHGCSYFLTEKELEGFSADSSYVKRMIYIGKERSNSIGF